MKSSLPSLLAVGLLGAAGWLMSRRGTQAPTSGSDTRTPLPIWGELDLSLPSFGDGFDWSFTGSDGAADTPSTYTGGDMSQPRGIRNNNPGNIEAGDPWQGLDSPSDDGRFARFVSPEYGIRAMAKVLETYATVHNFSSVGDIINRWAPVNGSFAGEGYRNHTTEYVKHVAAHLGVGVTQPIDIMARRPEIIEAMIQFENGQQPYAMATINKGVSLA